MIPSPGDKPLSELEDEQLKRMANSLAGGNIQYSLENVFEEMRFRRQNRIADSLRKIAKVQIFIAITAVSIATVVAVTSIVMAICN